MLTNPLIANAVAFSQTGAGSVPMALSTKLEECISVRDKGAVGGDDCTAAFNDAFTAANGRPVYVPPLEDGEAEYELDPNGLTVNEDATFFGNGYNSGIRMIAGTGVACTFTEQLSCYGLRFEGGASNQSAVAASASNRDCLSVNYNRESTLSDLWLNGFARYGVTGNNVAISRGLNLTATNLRAFACWRAFNVIANYAEYTRWIALQASGCREAINVQSGNVYVALPQFTDNGYGFVLTGTGIGNDAHGCVIGGGINHNTVKNIACTDVDFGHVFSGVNIFDGDVLLQDCYGVGIIGGVIDIVRFDFNSGGANLVALNHLVNPAQNTPYYTGGDLTQFLQNYLPDGTIHYGNVPTGKTTPIQRYTATVQEIVGLFQLAGLQNYALAVTNEGGANTFFLRSYWNSALTGNPLAIMDITNTAPCFSRLQWTATGYADNAAAVTAGVPQYGVYFNTTSNTLSVRT